MNTFNVFTNRLRQLALRPRRRHSRVFAEPLETRVLLSSSSDDHEDEDDDDDEHESDDDDDERDDDDHEVVNRPSVSLSTPATPQVAQSQPQATSLTQTSVAPPNESSENESQSNAAQSQGESVDAKSSSDESDNSDSSDESQAETQESSNSETATSQSQDSNASEASSDASESTTENETPSESDTTEIPLSTFSSSDHEKVAASNATSESQRHIAATLNSTSDHDSDGADSRPKSLPTQSEPVEHDDHEIAVTSHQSGAEANQASAVASARGDVHYGDSILDDLGLVNLDAAFTEAADSLGVFRALDALADSSEAMVVAVGSTFAFASYGLYERRCINRRRRTIVGV